MNIRVLGCHGSEQLVENEGKVLACRPCAFLVNDTVLVDAGTVGSALTIDEQRRIRYVLITHLHFDHIQGLPTLADNLVMDHGEPVMLMSLPEVLKGLQANIFNDTVYPDFTRLPSPQHPVICHSTLQAGLEARVGDLRVTAIPVNHPVPTVGFLIEDGASSVVFSGDTYQTDEIWKVASHRPTLKAAFIECSFPDALSDIARASYHLTPSLFAREYRKLGDPDLPVYAYHLKPRYRDMIRREITQLGIPKLSVLQEGHTVQV